MSSATSQSQQSVVLDPTEAHFASDARVTDLGRTHFIGIGGAGMSVLAEMLHQQGVAVSGSDSQRSEKTDRLEALGIPVHIGQQASNVEGADVVVYSSAIKPDNPEIVQAQAQDSKIVHRSDILALLMHGKRAVTVAGAHGKTTTSSLLSHILMHGGQGALADPSYAIGASIQGKDGTTIDGGHAGVGDVLVAEADESDGSFAKYEPYIAIVTNTEADHLDHYGTEARYQAAFAHHMAQAQRAIIVCVDDASALQVVRTLDPDIAARVIAYGTSEPDEIGDLNGATYVHIESERESAGSGREQFVLDIPQDMPQSPLMLPVELSVPGLHNARNATAAIIAAILLGMPAQDAAKAASSFLGAARRFQIRGTVGDITVVDDYAHHPTEIAALVDAARRKYPDATLHILFQPHLYSRTQFFAQEFAQALGGADDVIVTGIFPARERQEDFPEVSAQTIVQAAPQEAASRLEAVEDMVTAAQMVAMRAKPHDVIMTVGAGDITSMGPVVLHVLDAHHNGKDA